MATRWQKQTWTHACTHTWRWEVRRSSRSSTEVSLLPEWMGFLSLQFTYILLSFCACVFEHVQVFKCSHNTANSKLCNRAFLCYETRFHSFSTSCYDTPLSWHPKFSITVLGSFVLNAKLFFLFAYLFFTINQTSLWNISPKMYQNQWTRSGKIHPVLALFYHEHNDEKLTKS